MKRIETPLRQRVVNVRRFATPVAIWFCCAVVVTLIVGLRVGQMEYLSLSQVLEEWNALNTGAPTAVVDASRESVNGDSGTGAKGGGLAFGSGQPGMLAAPAVVQPVEQPDHEALWQIPTVDQPDFWAAERLDPINGSAGESVTAVLWPERSREGPRAYDSDQPGVER